MTTVNLMTMYPGMVNSPQTYLTNGPYTTGSTSITVNDASQLPAVGSCPYLACIGPSTGFDNTTETVTVTNVSGNTLTVTRATQGTAVAWASNSLISRLFTEYDYRALYSNINTLNSNMTNNTTDLECIKAGFNVTGGGTVTFDGSANLLWSSRLIIVSNGNGSDFSTDGYFEIYCPTSGTITGVGGHSNVTATASGIPLTGGDALYYILPIGSGHTSVAANFRIASYSSAIDIPSTWFLVALYNSTDVVGYVELCSGIKLATGTSGSATSVPAIGTLYGTSNLAIPGLTTYSTTITTSAPNMKRAILGWQVGGTNGGSYGHTFTMIINTDTSMNSMIMTSQPTMTLPVSGFTWALWDKMVYNRGGSYQNCYLTAAYINSSGNIYIAVNQTGSSMDWTDHTLNFSWVALQ